MQGFDAVDFQRAAQGQLRPGNAVLRQLLKRGAGCVLRGPLLELGVLLGEAFRVGHDVVPVHAIHGQRGQDRGIVLVAREPQFDNLNRLHDGFALDLRLRDVFQRLETEIGGDQVFQFRVGLVDAFKLHGVSLSEKGRAGREARPRCLTPEPRCARRAGRGSIAPW